MAPRRLSDAERLDWLRLSRCENVGPVTFARLMGRYGSAAAALEAIPHLSRKGGLGRPLGLATRAEAEDEMAKTLALGARHVAAGEDGYPEPLRHIHGAPPLLCIKGVAELAARPAVAIVGARNASAAGLKFTRTLAAELGEAGYVVASGLARGIDTAAHQAALAKGTVAVVAGGIGHVYPPENGALFADIATRGLLMSEMPPGAAPMAEHFPRRNRIISGMALATVVVEAALRSGSLITARLAAEQGREVFAAPGSPLDPRCEGSNRLIREGAQLLTSARDVIEALAACPPRIEPVQGSFLEQDEDVLFAGAEAEAEAHDVDDVAHLLSPTPIEVDDLIRESGLAPRTVVGLLLELELAGRLIRHSGGRVSTQ
ncbi:MAG TPA: DNA-processing protein DprA [Aestuariivirga sp.]|nr:DNA-processing protein DprA [Aestuariivirga sp.]